MGSPGAKSTVANLCLAFIFSVIVYSSPSNVTTVPFSKLLNATSTLSTGCTFIILDTLLIQYFFSYIEASALSAPLYLSGHPAAPAPPPEIPLTTAGPPPTTTGPPMPSSPHPPPDTAPTNPQNTPPCHPTPLSSPPA